jgi:hypothetical protein
VEQAYPAYALLSPPPPGHPSIDALRRHNRLMRDRERKAMTMHVVPPFKPQERLDTINKRSFALLGVCVGVNQLFEGTSQSDAVRDLFEQFMRQTSAKEPSSH